jgi:hypothetical protein
VFVTSHFQLLSSTSSKIVKFSKDIVELSHYQCTEDACDLTEYLQKRLGGLDGLYEDLNVLSVITFIPTIFFLVGSVHLALNGRLQWMIIVAPWLVAMIGYWYWRFKVLRVRCRDYRRRRDVEEYEKTLKLDSLRTPLLTSTAFATQFYFTMGGDGPALFAALFVGWFLVQMFIMGLSVLPYWVEKRQYLKRLRS